MRDDFRSELCMVGTIAELPRILEFVEHVCEETDIDPAATFDLKLAVEEACTNVIEHAYSRKGGELTVCFDVCGPDASITVTDHGRPFAPDEVALPDLSLPLEERPVGGLGLFLMQQLMDDVRFEFSADGNRLSMVKRGVRSQTA
jgi:anti-sigma regulatory factor (Ser/Thr protein kinase)